jgi:hypothetical protein
VEPDG